MLVIWALLGEDTTQTRQNQYSNIIGRITNVTQTDRLREVNPHRHNAC